MDSDFKALYDYGGIPKERVEQLEDEVSQ